MTATMRPDVSTNPYLAEYEEMLAHQLAHADPVLLGGYGRERQPWTVCMGCAKDRTFHYPGHHGIKRRYSWAIPNATALDAIAEHSPNGVVEIGAGGGYWAGLLRSRGVDVIAYDPDPAGGEWSGDGSKGWHDGTRWSDVLIGDHTAVIGHPDRALLLVWPSYAESWTDEVLDLYEGDTVIYVGEGQGGCTGTDRMHALLGSGAYCWHDAGDESCDCPKGVAAKFELVAEVDIPQFAGLHDRLGVYKRVVR